MLDIISGYSGLFKHPASIKYGSAIYCVADTSHTNLIMVLLSPSAISNAYELSKSITYQNIYYVIPALDSIFISDIFNLMQLISDIKPNARWVFPERPSIPTSVNFELTQIVSNGHIFAEWNINGDPMLHPSIEFILSNTTDRPFYDIILRDGYKTIYLCQYSDEVKIEELYTNELIDEIHIPYSSTIYGGLTYHDIINIDNKYHNKLVVHSFISIEEFDICTELNRVNTGKVVYNDIIQ